MFWSAVWSESSSPLVFSDWDAIDEVQGCSKDKCADAVNAGVDMFMVPKDWKSFIANTVAQVKAGDIPESRIDDAVTRILRVKIRAGMFARALIRAAAGQSIVLPAQAVLVKNGKSYIVYVKQKNGERYVRRDVTVGRSVDGTVQVLTGLSPGDEVVVKGALLIDGAAEQLL